MVHWLRNQFIAECSLVDSMHNRIKELRARCNLTQLDLALKVGVRRETIVFLEKGKYTSCDLEKPHYYFSAGKMKIYFDDKAIARPIVLHIADIPLLPFPFYMFPLKGNRSSGFRPTPIAACSSSA